MLNRPAHFMGKKGTHLLSRHSELLSSPLLLHHLRWFGPTTYTRDKYRAAAVQYIAQRSSASGEVLATHNPGASKRSPPSFECVSVTNSNRSAHGKTLRQACGRGLGVGPGQHR